MEKTNMEQISAAQASKLLGISIDKLDILEKQGLLHVTRQEGKEKLYLAEEIERIKSRHGLTLAEEAAQVGAQIQHEIVSSVTAHRKVLKLAGGVLSGYALLVALFAVFFIASPIETAKLLGIVKIDTNVPSLQESRGKQILGVQTNIIEEKISSIANILQPIGEVSLGLVKRISPNSYTEVSKIAILDTGDVLGLSTSGAIIPERPIILPKSSLLQIGSDELVTNLNSEFLQGKQPGTNAGDIAIVGDSPAPVITNTTVSGLTNTNLSGSAGITNANLANSALTVGTSGPLSGGGSVALGGTLTLTCPTCLTGSSFTLSSTDTLTNKTIAAGSNTITGLTNTNLSGSAGITNANLLNSSITTAGNSGSGSVSLGGGLTFAGNGITNIAASGSTLTITSSEADTLSSVTSRGATTSTALTLNGGVTTTTSTALTLDSGTTGAVSIGTGSNAKTITIGNTTGATALNLNAGSGNINFTVDGTGTSGKVQIGNSGTATPDLLVLDNGTSDPTGVNGGMYYNTSTGKFRCYEGSSWANCIGSGSGAGLDLLHAASYDTNEVFTNVGSSQVALGTVSVTPTSATGDVYVTGFAEVRSSNNTNQAFALVIETTSNCTGSTVGNASVTYTISTNTSTTTHLGNIRVSGITVDPGASAQPYSLCASTATGDTDVLNWGIEALVIDTGADLAEIYTTNDSSLDVGDVVSLDSSLQTGMKKSETPYDRSVLGIISGRPGLVIGGVDKEGVKAMPVALSGRIPVKVSSQNGAIKAGDYLTTSSIPGVAMKATKSGTIIGTAMISFEGDGVGQILVFVKNGSSMGSGDALTQLLNDQDSQLIENLSLSTEDTKGLASKSAQPLTMEPTNLISYITQIVSDLFKNTIAFFGNVIFHGDVTFQGRTTFNKDTAGHALIKAGEGEISINFEKEYAINPSVTASINLVGAVKPDELPQFAVYDINTKGFKIRLSRVAPSNISFSWIALGINEDNESESGASSTPVLNPSPSQEIVSSPTVTPSANPEQTESASPSAQIQ